MVEPPSWNVSYKLQGHAALRCPSQQQPHRAWGRGKTLSARVREKELATASDAEIIDFARQDGRIVVTLDANSAADVIRAQFDMRPQLLEANAQVVENNGRVAVHAARLCIVWRKSTSRKA